MGICVIIYICIYIYVCMYQSDKSRLSTWNHPVDFDPNLTVQWQSETVVLHDGPCHCLDLSVVTAETSCGMTMNLAGYKVTIKSQQGKTWIVLDATINIKKPQLSHPLVDSMVWTTTESVQGFVEFVVIPKNHQTVMVPRENPNHFECDLHFLWCSILYHGNLARKLQKDVYMHSWMQ